MITDHIYLYKHVSSDMGIHLSKEKRNIEILKAYIFVKI